MLTKDSSVVTTYIIGLLRDNAVPLGVKRVYRGETNLIPEYPAISVRSGPKRRGYATTQQYGVDLRTIITIMHGVIGETEQSELDVDLLTEAVENLLHDDRTLGAHPDNLVYTSWVEAVEPGVRLVGTNQIRATRMTHRAESREVLR